MTIRITPFHAERDGILAPREVMEDAYIRTVPVSDVYKRQAYELASKELLAANQIGDTKGNATVTKADGTTKLDATNGDGTFKMCIRDRSIAD